MDNIRLQQRVADLELALENVRNSIENVSKIDNSYISLLTFEDGFNHALRLVAGSVQTFINPLLDSHEKH